MALTKIDLFGAPNYGRLKGMEAVVFHTPENTDPTIEAAVSTARWQAGAGNTSGGSYHGILGHDDDLGPMSKPEAWVLVKTVPFGDIAGSISTNRDPAVWQPGRYPWIRDFLSPAAYADPNAYFHALSLGGKASWWSNKLSTAAGRAEVMGAITALAMWVRKLERLFGHDPLLVLHRHFQTNRTDPDGLGFADLVLDEYVRLFVKAPAEPAEQPEPTTPVEPAPTEPSWSDRMRARVAELEGIVEARDATIAEKSLTITNLRARLAKVDPLADQMAALAAKMKEV